MVTVAPKSIQELTLIPLRKEIRDSYALDILN